MIIEFLGATYTIGKVAYSGFKIIKYIKERFEIKEGEPKRIDSDWVEKSGFNGRMKDEGYELRWVRSERVETLKLDNWELVYEVDKEKKVKQRLVQYDDTALMGKKA